MFKKLFINLIHRLFLHNVVDTDKEEIKEELRNWKSLY